MTEDCCLECGDVKRFYFFAFKGPDGDMTLSIPAEDEKTVMGLLGSLVVNPEQWERQPEIEKSMNNMRTTGAKRKKTVSPTGPMYG